MSILIASVIPSAINAGPTIRAICLEFAIHSPSKCPLRRVTKQSLLLGTGVADVVALRQSPAPKRRLGTQVCSLPQYLPWLSLSNTDRDRSPEARLCSLLSLGRPLGRPLTRQNPPASH